MPHDDMCDTCIALDDGYGPKRVQPSAPAICCQRILIWWGLGSAWFGQKPCLRRRQDAILADVGVRRKSTSKTRLLAEACTTKCPRRPYSLHLDLVGTWLCVVQPATLPPTTPGCDFGRCRGSTPDDTSEARLLAEACRTKCPRRPYSSHLDLVGTWICVVCPKTLPPRSPGCDFGRCRKIDARRHLGGKVMGRSVPVTKGMLSVRLQKLAALFSLDSESSSKALICPCINSPYHESFHTPSAPRSFLPPSFDSIQHCRPYRLDHPFRRLFEVR